MAAMLVARIESWGPETVGISSYTKVSGPPPDPARPEPEKSGNHIPYPYSTLSLQHSCSVVAVQDGNDARNVAATMQQ